MSITCWSDEPDAVRATRMADMDEAYRQIAHERQLLLAVFEKDEDELPEPETTEWREMVWVAEAFADAALAQLTAIANSAHAATA